MPKFTLIFMDGTSQEIEADDFSEAWVKGKIEAANRKTHLVSVSGRG